MLKKCQSYILAFLMMALLTILLTPFKSPLGVVNIALIYLLPVLYSAAKWGTGPALVAASTGVVTFDFYFIPPVLSFTVADFRYLISFAIFLLVGIIIANLSTKLKNEIINSKQRENRIASLYKLSRDIAAVSDLDSVMNSVTNNIAEIVEGQVILLLPDENNRLILKASSQQSAQIFDYEKELQFINWVFVNGIIAGGGAENNGIYLPLIVEQGIQGVMGVYNNSPGRAFKNDQKQLLEAYAGLTALALNRINLAEQAKQAKALAESERLRTALFNSLSHDLRTPLSSIIGAVTGLLEEGNIYSPAARQDLLQTIKQGAMRMNRFIINLLDMARFESGMLKLKKEWCDIQDIIGVAINRLGDTIHSRQIKVTVQPNLPLVQADFLLIEQVIINLLDNALKYSAVESNILINAVQKNKQLQVSITDRGPQIPEEDISKIFDKFYRLSSSFQVSGTGLGLAICKGIIEAHGGTIWAENNPDNGVTFIFVLTLNDNYPDHMPIIEEGE